VRDLQINSVAKWDGLQWSPLGEGTSSGPQALASFDDGQATGPALFAGGSFTLVDGLPIDRIARWGCSTSSCDADFDNDGQVDGFDLGILLLTWGLKGGQPDLNDDFIVDGADLGLLLLAWGACR
jgi:hypothetical protein